MVDPNELHDLRPGISPEFVQQETQWNADEDERKRSRWILAGLIVAFSAFCFAYKALVWHNLGHTGLMFLGLPTILAVLLAFAPPARTATGGIMKGITFALLVPAPLLGEGYLCILIAAPLFYLVGALIGWIVDRSRRPRSVTLGCVTLLMLPMCLEGTLPQLSLQRARVVEARRVVNAPAKDVEQALAGSMQIARPLPRFLRIGFPRPVQAWGGGLSVGDERGLHFTGAEGTPPGDLRMRVAQARTGYVRMQVVSDGSKVTEWLRWRDTEVLWRPLDASHTEVVARVHYERGLDPAWYFGAWEHFAVRQAADYLIEANATPVDAR